ncbi:glycoside hydrolase family 68 protein [Congregibacter variabilis]|uniref:levansucrase n=1 Tax=Congregibacter variabilis TaxID=3081200 RepID=A0ABZ0I1G0_9GAMM|nr:glycoside hydrolase family 68 protein [Congregibacter sp. IMCC43200]
MTTYWQPESLAGLTIEPGQELEVFDANSLQCIDKERWYWDQCPVCDEGGQPVSFGAMELWITLSAPAMTPPESRHDYVRMRLLTRTEGYWQDWGNLLPDGFSIGSCEWAGAANVDRNGVFTLYYTVKGTAGEASPTYCQRIFAAQAKLAMDAQTPRLSHWMDLGEQIRADGSWYELAFERSGEMGGIKAFRDPFWLRDVVSGREYLLFAASAVEASTKKNAAIGIASREHSCDPWELHPPLLIADGVTNEMERPHLLHSNGLYYLFWSVHGWTFDQSLGAPTALYGMVSESLDQPFRPLNETCLVAANPTQAKFQAYSWLVDVNLQVCSFVDLPDGQIDDAPSAPAYPQGTFRGGFAPDFFLTLDGTKAGIRRS